MVTEKSENDRGSASEPENYGARDGLGRVQEEQAQKRQNEACAGNGRSYIEPPLFQRDRGIERLPRYLTVKYLVLVSIIEYALGFAGNEGVVLRKDLRRGQGAFNPVGLDYLRVVQSRERRLISKRIESPTFWNDR